MKCVRIKPMSKWYGGEWKKFKCSPERGGCMYLYVCEGERERESEIERENACMKNALYYQAIYMKQLFSSSSTS